MRLLTFRLCGGTENILSVPTRARPPAELLEFVAESAKYFWLFRSWTEVPGFRNLPDPLRTDILSLFYMYGV